VVCPTGIDMSMMQLLCLWSIFWLASLLLKIMPGSSVSFFHLSLATNNDLLFAAFHQVSRPLTPDGPATPSSSAMTLVCE
jgi:hypothetical protein